MKFPRLTIRRLMVTVAIVGIVLGPLVYLGRRSSRFKQMSWAHERAMSDGATEAAKLKRRGDPQSKLAYARADFHQAMWLKYFHAARSPWLPVEPDPPEPKTSPWSFLSLRSADW
jgi:hypothetical protein